MKNMKAYIVLNIFLHVFYNKIFEEFRRHFDNYSALGCFFFRDFTDRNNEVRITFF